MLNLRMMRFKPCAAALLAAGLVVSLATAGAAWAGKDGPRLRFLGEVRFPTGLQFEGTEVGGLSGIDYDPSQGLYYAISDDRSSINPARFYELTIDLDDGRLDDGDVVFQRVVTILNEQGAPFAPLSLDPESIRSDPKRKTLFWTSEGDANALVPPAVREMERDGTFVQELEKPAKYDPTADNSSGIRNNLAFESLTLQGSAHFLFGHGSKLLTATENALNQDGPAASLTEGSPVRILQLDQHSDKPLNEYIYVTEKVAEAPNPAGSFSTNGLCEILSLDEKRFLALERAFSTGAGNTIRIFLADLSRATNVRRLDSIAGVGIRTVKKELLLDLDTLGIPLDNIEGITFGPRLRTGERTLILVSDNNFNAVDQFTQFLAFAIKRGSLGEW
jgi:hypothetical protein